MFMVKVDESERRLLNAALRAMENAHVLWGLKVGAAVLAEDRHVYGGCNVESWISGLGTCAERCAINHAVLHGNRKIREIAIVMSAESHDDPRPCGVCLQYIYDFGENSKIRIVTAKVEKDRILFETVNVKTLEEMLPFPFKK
jgi:cytidine deaminase